MNNLEVVISENIDNEFYQRGYGAERLGSVNLQNDWVLLFLVALALYLFFK